MSKTGEVVILKTELQLRKCTPEELLAYRKYLVGQGERLRQEIRDIRTTHFALRKELQDRDKVLEEMLEEAFDDRINADASHRRAQLDLN